MTEPLFPRINAGYLFDKEEFSLARALIREGAELPGISEPFSYEKERTAQSATPQIRSIVERAGNTERSTGTITVREFIVFVFIIFLAIGEGYLLLAARGATSEVQDSEVKVSRLESRVVKLTSAVKSLADTAALNSELLETKRIEAAQPQPVTATEISNVAPDLKTTSTRALVITSKANLRFAPNQEARVLMTVTKGAELEIKETQNSWFRITAPTGEEAWISSSVVQVQE